MDQLFAATNLLRYRLTSGNAHDVHSPFVFGLLNDVISDTTPYYCYKPIEQLRSQLLADKRTITVNDFGASKNPFTYQKKVCEIANSSLQTKKYSQLLFRLVNHFGCQQILEIGTSFGISTLYLAMSSDKSNVITLEGSMEIASIAIENFQKLKQDNIECVIGNFDDTLPKIIHRLPNVDFVYFDGNHRKEATLNYFEQCLKIKNNESIFVFDDIYWSREMASAWKIICRNPEVKVSIDLFKLGIIFFKNDLSKQHYRLKF